MPNHLYLIPTNLHEESFNLFPSINGEIISRVKIYFAEDPKLARAFIKKILPSFNFQNCEFLQLSEHTTLQEITSYEKYLLKQDCAIISDAGCPTLADPGAPLVLLAHKNNVRVVALVGPSSILLALMSSGLNGQKFSFEGYLPKDRKDRINVLKNLEKQSRIENQTKIFIETPYRNDHLLEDILLTLQPNTLLCLACNLTAKNQFVTTKTVGEWKRQVPNLKDKPTVFLFQAASK